MIAESQLRFRHLPTGREVKSIWDDLHCEKSWRHAEFIRHESNALAGASDRSGWQPVIADWLPIYSGQEWSNSKQLALDPTYTPANGPGDLDNFLDAAYANFSRYDGLKIGVQLSGGLDSSLIIGLLQYFGIPYALVGLCSDRYEFRAERHVQETIAEKCCDVELIDETSCLPCSDLDRVAPHQIPDLISLNYAQDTAMAEACERLGIKVLFSGGGGDNLLGQAVPVDPSSCDWRPQTFTDSFPMDIIYSTQGIEFRSFFEDLGVVDALYRLRCGQKDDYKKCWARNFFRDFLPREIVNYTYCSDFWGRDIDGLVKNLPVIRELHRKAASLTGNDYFAAEHLEALLVQDLLRPQKELYQRIEARISSAVWVCALAGRLDKPSGVELPFNTITEPEIFSDNS